MLLVHCRGVRAFLSPLLYDCVCMTVYDGHFHVGSIVLNKDLTE